VKRTYPAAEYNYDYGVAPRSGNDINGLDVTERVRAVQIFHGSGFRKLEWEAMEMFFLMTMPFRLFIRGMRSRLLLRNADGRISKKRIEIDNPERMSIDIKQKAIDLGAGAAGVTEMIEAARYQGVDHPYKYAISVLYPMDFEFMNEHVTDLEGGIHVIKAYTEITDIVVKLAAHIRAMGWPARAYCESADLLHIPLAVNAGLGELGKHGSLISREHGSNFRLATVLTELPLATDSPEDIGVDDLCMGCQRCTVDCPADAISDGKKIVRGIEKWYVDFDKCVPYFSKTFGCGICIHVCPWSKPGRGPALSEKLLAKRRTD
jgi:epoxyqueuosine reductase